MVAPGAPSDAGKQRGPRVLFVSKAVAPPFRDGAACLVRDLSQAFCFAAPTVLTTEDAPALEPTVRMDRFYRKPSRYAPALADNVRVLHHLLRDRDHDLWHFVFAPNPLSSHAGRLVRAIRRRPVVQTVASRPLRFEAARMLLFGDRIVALSKHTADRLVRHGAPSRRITVIPPPAVDLSRSEDEQRDARAQAGIDPAAPLLLYAGDLEFSSGARYLAEAAPLVLRQAPDAILAFACRTKTPRAVERRDELAAQLRSLGDRVRFLGEVRDLPALTASACALPFPVDDLYGKVDHPYVVLEGALLQVPVMVPEGGPLAEIHGIPTMRGGDVRALASWCVDMVRDADARRQVGAALRKAVLAQHDPGAVAARVEAIYDDLLR
jgi:glycosyltransferase involved in cell wall biosynthesis